VVSELLDLPTACLMSTVLGSGCCMPRPTLRRIRRTRGTTCSASSNTMHRCRPWWWRCATPGARKRDQILSRSCPPPSRLRRTRNSLSASSSHPGISRIKINITMLFSLWRAEIRRNCRHLPTVQLSAFTTFPCLFHQSHVDPEHSHQLDGSSAAGARQALEQPSGHVGECNVRAIAWFLLGEVPWIGSLCLQICLQKNVEYRVKPRDYRDHPER
jgi:hypothetical protein